MRTFRLKAARGAPSAQLFFMPLGMPGVRVTNGLGVSVVLLVCYPILYHPLQPDAISVNFARGKQKARGRKAREQGT